MPLQPDNPLFLAGIVAAIGSVLIVLWLLTLIYRLLIRRPPSFPAWQPAYHPNPLAHPDSTAGRRQLWQTVALSDVLPASAEPGAAAARKLLTDMSGVPLKGWQIVGLRLCQYDMYGRVARTQVIAPRRLLRPLNRAVAHNQRWTAEKIASACRRAARPLAREMAGRARRTPALPVAVDVRFSGLRGEVRLFFELVQAGPAGWQRIDFWEPEMLMSGERLLENYAYALLGQQPGETPRQFRTRLADDLTHTLTAMIVIPPPPPPPAAPPTPVPVSTPQAALLIADDTAPIAVPPPAVTETAPLPTEGETESSLPRPDGL